MKKIAIITARSGSKGLPNKNVLMTNGKPLIAYSIEAAIDSQCFDKIIVTTDSQEYLDLLSGYPIDFVKREEHLSTDTASSFVVIEDVMEKYKNFDYEYFVLLQPTSPLRTSEHIKEACDKFEKNITQFDYLVSVAETAKSTTLMREIDNDESLKNFDLDYSNYARQNFYPEYTPNGAIFIAKPLPYLEQKHFYGKRSLAYKMDKISSIDIDDREDFEYFYFILQRRNKKQILLNNIKNGIAIKQNLFNIKADISLIGHSILGQWDIESLSGKEVVNWGVAGISTREYIDLIVDQQLIQNIGNTAILMTGTNDIVRDGWSNERILNDVQELVDKIRMINPDISIYFLEITPTAFRTDRNNTEIISLNEYLKRNLKDAYWIDLYESFSDKYQKLNMEYSGDGLHLNKKGYEALRKVVESCL